MKYLGLDLGSKTLGLAISDRLGLISSPYKVLRYNDINDLVIELKEIINKEQINKLVLGLPKNMNNTIGPRAEKTLEFKKIIENEFNLEVILEDERLSTVEAERHLINSNVRRENRKKVIDSIAASIILDSHLRRINHERGN